MKELIADHQHEFAYAADRRQLFWVDHPDVRLLANIIFVTKLLHPLDDIPRFATNSMNVTPFRIDWSEWRAAFAEPAKDDAEPRNLASLRPEDVWLMTEKQMDEYLDWYQRTKIKKSDGPSPISYRGRC